MLLQFSFQCQKITWCPSCLLFVSYLLTIYKPHKVLQYVLGRKCSWLALNQHSWWTPTPFRGVVALWLLGIRYTWQLLSVCSSIPSVPWCCLLTTSIIAIHGGQEVPRCSIFSGAGGGSVGRAARCIGGQCWPPVTVERGGWGCWRAPWWAHGSINHCNYIF
jgi:hypothetical protein